MARYHGSAAAILLTGALACACATRNDDGARATSRGSVALPPPDSTRSVPVSTADTAQSMTHFTSPGPVELGALPVRVLLAPASAGASLGTRLERLAPGHRLHLVLDDVRAERQPGTLFQLFLDLPEGAAPRAGDPHRVGSINFYDAIRDPGSAARSDARSSRSFDITDAVSRLKAAGQLAELTSVTVVASRPPEAGAGALIGRIRIVEQ